MSMRPFVCREMVELMTEYLEDALSPTDRERFEAHLRRCDGCTEYLAQLRAQLRMAGGLSESKLDPIFRDRLITAFRDWRRS